MGWQIDTTENFLKVFLCLCGSIIDSFDWMIHTVITIKVT